MASVTDEAKGGNRAARTTTKYYVNIRSDFYSISHCYWLLYRPASEEKQG